MPRLILASGSPRRRQLLSDAGYQFEVMVPNAAVEDGICSSCGPAELVAELALRKANDIARQIEEGVLIAADTVAECGGQILGKPVDEDHARQMLTQLSSARHRVYTGLCVWKLPSRTPEVRVAVTELEMDRLAPSQLSSYLASRQWEGKAGAFGYQDGLDWVHIVEGSESNVVGLPMELLAEMLPTDLRKN